MFERFTDRARRVLVLAQEEARLLGHNFIGTEHILLGLVHEGEGVGARALEELHIDLRECRRQIEEVIGRSNDVASGPPPFTPRAKKVLEFSLREALRLGHNYIGTEHLLLGLINEGEGVGAQVLVKMGADLASVNSKVIELLTRHGLVATPETLRQGRRTPAGRALDSNAREQAGSEAVGTHHYLLGLLDDANSLAARVLQSLGVTAEAVRDRIATLGTGGTSDEITPTKAGFELGLGGGVTLRVDDLSLADDLRVAFKSASEAVPAVDIASIIRKAIAERLSASLAEPDPIEPPEPEPGPPEAEPPE